MNLVKANQPVKNSRLCGLYPGIAALWRHAYGHAKVPCRERRVLSNWGRNGVAGHFIFNGIAGAMANLFTPRLPCKIQIPIAGCTIQRRSPSPAVSSLGAYTTPAP